MTGPSDGPAKSIIRTRRNAEADDSGPAEKSLGSSSSNGRQRNGSKRSSATLQALEASLSEEAIREDFVTIVRDTDARAETFALKYQKVCKFCIRLIIRIYKKILIMLYY
jgi:hypothetical protein